MSLHRKKKPVEFHFVDMNDPGRYKKLKVARACDFCRRRKSKCDIGVPGSGTCSNCHKHQVVCVFSPVPIRGNESARLEETPTTPREFFDYFHFRYPLLYIYNAQAGYEKDPHTPTCSSSSSSTSSTHHYNSNLDLSIPHPIDQHQKLYHYHAPEISSQLESQLFDIYFEYIHPAYPILLKQSILNIFTQNRHMLNKGLRYAIISTATHFYSLSGLRLNKNSTSFDSDLALLSTGNHVLYEAAQRELNLDCPKLETVQSLLLLYKYDEISGRSVQNTYYLEMCMKLLGKLQSALPQQEEMINRSRWMLFISIGLSNLTDKRFNQLYIQLDLPTELPQSLDEEEEPSHRQHMNQFAQIANLSVLYSHTVQSLITGANSNLICIKQFREIRQHWNDSLHLSTLQKLATEEKIPRNNSTEINSGNHDDTTTDKEIDKNVDILIMYNAILYDMLYLILLLHHKLEIEGVEIADRLLIMINSWINRSNFSSTVSSHRMAAFGLTMCLQIHLKAIRNSNYCSNKSITTIVQEIQRGMKRVQRDPRVDKELTELYDYLITSPLPLQYQQQPQDYFSIIPLQLDSTSSSPLEHSLSTPGLWDLISTGDITTPITEEEQVLVSNAVTTPITETVDLASTSSEIGVGSTASYENMLKWVTEQQLHDPITPAIAPTTATDSNLAADYFSLTLESCCYSEDSNPVDPKSQTI